MTLNEERRKVEEQRRSLERERKEFSRWVESEDRRLEQQQQLFDMKFKILEEELRKLASEKEKIQRQKAYYSSLSDSRSGGGADSIVKGELFFSGVGSRQSLKKRYKDLVRIYHPDNVDGDTDTIQEINSEYSKLCALYGI